MHQTESSQLRVKSYFASSVPDAIVSAKMELGPDALLVKSRPTAPEYRHLGSLEVVFGIPAEPPHLKPATSILPKAGSGVEDVLKRLESIHQLLLSPQQEKTATPGPTASVEKVLTEHGIPGEIARDIANSVLARMTPRTLEITRVRRGIDGDPDVLRRELTAELNARIRIKNQLSRVTALVGPAGTGKTTTLIKLAVAEGLLKRRPVRLISADCERVGAAEQLQSFASILGIPCEVVGAAAQLRTTIAHTPEKYLILIDTPGYSPALFQQRGHDLVEVFHRQEIDTQLVLTANMRRESMDAAVKRFDVFRPSALIFTHLDETESLHVVGIEALRHQMALSWLCAGQMVPEDINLADPAEFVAALVTQMPLGMRSAA